VVIDVTHEYLVVGFLAGYPGLPNNEYHDRWDKRLKFALGLFVKMPAPVAASMVLFSIFHTLIYGTNSLLRSLAPDFVLAGPDEPVYEPSGVIIGDNAAKDEARRMFREFVPTASNPADVKVHEPDVLPSPYN